MAFVEASDPSTLNGGSAMAMAGRGCVALAVDKRFGSGPQMVNISPRRVLILHSHLMIGFTGLQSDVESVAEELSVQATKRTNRGSSFGFPTQQSFVPKQKKTMMTQEKKDDESELKSDSDNVAKYEQSITHSSLLIAPRVMSSLTSHVLYSRRRSPYYCEPILVGLEPIHSNSASNDDDDEDDDDDDDDSPTPKTKTTPQYKPFMCAQDLIGAQSYAQDFCCSGAAYASMYGTAEAMWRPNMDPETLARVCGRAFLSALERDCLSGYGAIVYVLTEDGGIVEYDLEARND